MKIYTKTGDDGTTGLFGGTRVSKSDARVEAYGDVDELNSCLGIIVAMSTDKTIQSQVMNIQDDLFYVGAELGSAPSKRSKGAVPVLDASRVEKIEQAINEFESELEPLKTFVLPGGSPLAAHIHLARTVCRRAERRVVALRKVEPVRDALVQYLNRISDYLFVLARVANHRAGVSDVPWHVR